MRILIVEDEEKLAKGLSRGLEKEGYAVDYVTDGIMGERRALLHHEDYDLIILDLMLPGKEGSEICKSIRENNITTPIIILTARDLVSDKITMLNAGADDYLPKPFSFQELAARIRAILRRPHISLPPVMEVGKLRINQAAKKAYYGEKELDLTLKEYSILEYLVINRGQAISREQIHSHIWDFADDSLSNAIDVHIKNLRKKIDATDRVVETVRGIGYRVRPVQQAS